MKKRWPALVILIALALLPLKYSGAAITSVTLSPAVATTLSNGLSYYLAGRPYTFKVQAVDPAATQQADWNQITLQFRTGAVMQNQCVININTAIPTMFSETGVIVDAISNNLGDFNNIEYDITLRFLWTATEYRVLAGNDVRAEVSSFISVTQNATNAFGYGVISSITLVNFAHTGVAADRRINPYHDAFNVTGSVVYRANPLELQTTIADRVATVSGDLSSVGTIRIDGANQAAITPIAFGGTDDFAFSVPAQHFTAFALGNRVWSVIATMNTPGPAVTETSIDPLVTAPVTITVDRVRITLIEIINGGGVPGPPIYRSLNIPGTQVRITAQMEWGGGSMVGNTSITVRNVTDGVNFPVVVIASGATQGVGNVTYPLVVAGNTDLKQFDIEAISGGAYGGDTFPNGQSNPGRMAAIAPVDIYWDNQDPPGLPGAGVAFIPDVTHTTTAYSLTLTWTPLTNPFDGDLDTYRVYYRTSQVGAIPPGPWLMLDRTSGGLYTALGNYLTPTITINDLNPLTGYDYYLSAVDVFGNVVAVGKEAPQSSLTPQTATTQPKSIECTITDGQLSYQDTHFVATKAGSSRLLRKTAIKVTFFIVTVGGQPDYANILLVNGDYNVYSTIGVDEFILDGTNDIRPAYILNTHYYRIACNKTAPNTWVAYIPETNPFMQNDNTLSFMLELIRSGGTTYSDATKSEVAPGDPNNEKWAFKIGVPTVFTPWPTRILNNVITRSNPVAYPSFYLSEDAFVTIRIYDIKGRPVVTLIDNLYQKGGQNIVAGGWNAVNRYNRSVGAGLYHVHIQARGVVSGKIILNSFKKVVVAK